MTGDDLIATNSSNGDYDFSPKNVFRNEPEPIPDQVRVVGAGTIEVNGVYQRTSSDFHDAPCYEKEGIWEEQPVVFRIIKEADGDSWYLDASNVKRGTGSEVTFYHGSTISQTTTNMPPETGWASWAPFDDTVAKEPVPILAYGRSVPRDWRFDPLQSQSDWTIQVSAEDKNNNSKMGPVYNYHVHLNVIAMGPRASGYFVQVCQSKHFCESKDKMSRIKLHSLAAEQFPIMLDFIYDRPLRINTDNAIILLHLAKYFDCAAMLRQVNDFCTNKLDTNSCARYYKHAATFQLFDVIKAVEKFCVEHIHDIEVYDDIVECGAPSFWASVLSKVSMSSELSKTISRIVARVCKNHKNKLDKVTFKRLTENLTHISVREAATLLDLELSFMSNEKQLTDADPRHLTSLQEKCIAAMAQGLGIPNESPFLKLPEGCPSVLYNQLLEKASVSVEARLANASGVSTIRRRAV